MPSSQAAATERRNDRIVTHEPPKLKTTLKTPPKQATNPLQFVKVGPCSLYRTAQEQLSKVQEVKKIKQEVRDDPEDWQSNLDNWKSSRRKRQEHIIERVVEVKKLELEEHDRQRRRSKTFSEMMEERNSRGRKLSMSLPMYHEEDANDLSDLGIGTSSGKSSVSGDTHDDMHSVLSDRDSEIEKNHSDIENASHENGNTMENNNAPEENETPTMLQPNKILQSLPISKKPTIFGNGYHNDNENREYDSATTATASSPEPEEYTYEGAIRGYVSRVSQNIPRRSLTNIEPKLESPKPNDNDDNEKTSVIAVVKVDVLKRREIFEKASHSANSTNNNNNNQNLNCRSSGDLTKSKSIKERLSCLEKQNSEYDISTDKETKAINRLSGDMSSIRERLSHLEKQTSERENKVSHRKLNSDELESVRPLRERLTNLEKYSSNETSTSAKNGSTEGIGCGDDKKTRPVDKQLVRFVNEGENSSERSSSPDSEYRANRAPFHRSLDSLDADASSGPDTFERVQSLEELDYANRYPASSSVSAELLNDTDREDSGIHTADVSCSVSQADEEVASHHPETIIERQESAMENYEFKDDDKNVTNKSDQQEKIDGQNSQDAIAAAVTTKDTAETSTPGKSPPTNNKYNATTLSPFNKYKSQTNANTSRPIVYQSPRIPPRRTRSETESQTSATFVVCDSTITKATSESGALEIDEFSPGVSGKCSIAHDSKRASKIPTPLPRKTLKIPTVSSSLPSIASPGKINVAPKFPSKFTVTSQTKIPFSTSPNKIHEESGNEKQQLQQRRPVVEVCEKVVVTQGEITVSPPATPFITVLRIPKERSNEESIVIDSAKAVAREEEEHEEQEEQATLSVDHEETRSDGPTMDLLVIEDLSVNQLRESIDEIQEQPEIASITSPLPLQSSPSLNNKLITEKPEISQLNHMDFFSVLSTSKQIPQLNLSSNDEFVTGLTFPMGPLTSVEPPKEKPPPPPTDLSDEENLPVEPLKRLNSTRRIKKELRTRRSDFLGIEGINDEDLERELTLTKPPDMAAILAEERRIEQLHRRSYDTDSNYEQDSSHERDSGVELGHGHEDWSKQPVSPDMSQHSRQSSEPFGASVTSSEEDEITKKEREIIEVLEKEEQWRYGNDREQNSDIGEKLAHKLRELEEEKMQLERERAQEIRRQEETLRKNDENARNEEEILQQQRQEIARQQEAERAAETAKRIEEKKQREDELLKIKTEQIRLQGEIDEKERRSAEVRRQEEIRIRTLEGQIRVHEQMPINSQREDDFASGEVLRVERELLQLEQEELKRQRTNMAYREQRQMQLAEQLQEQWQSLQDVANVSINGNASSQLYKYQAAPMNYRSSMPNLQLQDGHRRRPPPPPIPPSKPSRLVEQMQRDVTIRNSRVPSADSIPQQVDGSIRHSASATTLSSHAGQQMTKQTLQALSAVPRSRIVKGDQWVQRRKSDVPRGTLEYNYQHWLIQEAEQRRINEKNQRSVVRKPQQHVTGTSVPYVGSPTAKADGKPLPDSVIQTLTQRVQNRAQERPSPPRRRLEQSTSHEHLSTIQHQLPQHAMLQHQKVHQFSASSNADSQEKMLSVSGKKKCSHCGDELGRGAAMIIESLRLFYHMECFKCCVCHVRLGDGLMGTDVRVRNHKLHCHNCYSSDDGVKFSCV